MGRTGTGNRHRRIAVVVTAVLALTACAAPEEPAEVRAGPGPLTRIADIDGLMPDDAAGVIAATAAREEAIAACLHEAGFSYWPQIPGPDEIEFIPEADHPRGSVDFAERYGYGLWHSPTEDGGIAFSMPSDPDQQAYLAAMSEPERESYDTALWGPIIAEDSDGSITRSGGCTDRVNQVPDADAAERAFLAGVSDDFNAFFEALPADPAFDELNREWAACLRDAGYQGASPAAAELQAVADFTAALEAAGWNLTAAMRAEHGPAEIALATADAECRVQVDYAVRHADIQWDLEQAYVDGHAADLEAYRQAMAG